MKEGAVRLADIKQKRHVGSIFEFVFEDLTFQAICVAWDEQFGYLVGFSETPQAFDHAGSYADIERATKIFGFLGLDAQIRRGFGKKKAKLPWFVRFQPLLRGGGGYRPDGTEKSWMTWDGFAWTHVDKSSPELPSLSECTIYDIGTIKDFLVSGRTVDDLFHGERLCY